MAHYSKISLLITLCIFFVLCMSGCSSSGSSSSGGAQTDVKSISIINAPEYLDFNATYLLQIDKPELNIMWDTSNQDLLEIDNNGLIRAKMLLKVW